MIEKRYWPFEVYADALLTEDNRQIVRFLETAFREGHQSYAVEGGMAYAARAKDGREGTIVCRGGKGRYWEIVLEENEELIKSAYIDGFEFAASAALSWLRGDDLATAIGQIEHAIVNKPGERGR